VFLFVVFSRKIYEVKLIIVGNKHPNLVILVVFVIKRCKNKKCGDITIEGETKG